MKSVDDGKLTEAVKAHDDAYSEFMKVTKEIHDRRKGGHAQTDDQRTRCAQAWKAWVKAGEALDALEALTSG